MRTNERCQSTKDRAVGSLRTLHRFGQMVYTVVPVPVCGAVYVHPMMSPDASFRSDDWTTECHRDGTTSGCVLEVCERDVTCVKRATGRVVDRLHRSIDHVD